MKARIGLWMAAALWLAGSPALSRVCSGQSAPPEPPAPAVGPAQVQPQPGLVSPYAPPQNPAQPAPVQIPASSSGQGPAPPQDTGPAAGPQIPAGQPLAPHDPTIQRRPGPPPPPFVLTPEQQRELDGVLQAWEQNGKQVRTFECQFTRFEYDLVFGDGRTPRFEDKGQIKYAAPDKGLFRVEAPRQEQWVCDGESVFEYKFKEKQLIEHRLPPELQHNAIADGPLPFLFGMEAQKLKERYFLRVTSSDPNQGEVRLEAHPKYRKDAANFRQADLILRNMQPFGVQIHSPNGKSRTVYVLENIRVNPRDPLNPLDPLKIFHSDPFRAATPRGWQKIVDDPPPVQPAQVPPQIRSQPTLGLR